MPGALPTESGGCSVAATWWYLTWVIPDIPDPVQFTQALTFAHHHLMDIGARRWDQTNMSACRGSNKNTKHITICLEWKEPNRWVRMEDESTSPAVCLCIFLQRNGVLVADVGISSVSPIFWDTPFFMEWQGMGCQTFKLVCTQLTEWHMPDWSQSSLGLQASRIGHVVVWEMCRNYMWFWPESKLRQRWPHPTRPHVCTKLKKKNRQQHGWHQLWIELLNRSV